MLARRLSGPSSISCPEFAGAVDLAVGPRSRAGTAEAISQSLDGSAWRRLAAGEGTTGARPHDWADCELADLNAAEDDDHRTGLWTRGLLIRRSVADGDRAFVSTWCPPERISRCWSGSRDIVGQSRTASKPPGTSWGSTATRPVPGTAGTVASRSSSLGQLVDTPNRQSPNALTSNENRSCNGRCKTAEFSLISCACGVEAGSER
jgi:hypothetical protein